MSTPRIIEGPTAWRLVRLFAALAAIPALLWACNSHTLEKPVPSPEQQTNDRYVINANRDIDLLFVIDDSGSTNNKQQNFAQNFPAFMRALQMIPGGLPNVRIAVVSSDLGAGGAMTSNMCAGIGAGARFRTTDATGIGCGLTAGAQWITPENLEPGRTIEQVFACMATRNAVGCGFEHQLQSAVMALRPRLDWNPMNEGFLRPDAYLGIVFLTDEDDCSGPEGPPDFFATPVPGYTENGKCAMAGHLCNGAPPPPMAANFPLGECTHNPNPMGLIPVQKMVDDIMALKPGKPDKIVVAAIAGWPAPGQEGNAQYRMTGGGGGVNVAQVCAGAGGGTPALRIKAFLESFPNHGLHTVCQDNFAGALTAIGNLVATVVGNPCLSAPLVDTNPQTEELEADCAVVDKIGDQVTPLPACAPGGPRPCWRLEPAANCMASGRQIFIDRGNQMPPPQLEQTIKCRTCVQANDPRCRRR